jgi:hypothetical protein
LASSLALSQPFITDSSGAALGGINGLEPNSSASRASLSLGVLSGGDQISVPEPSTLILAALGLGVAAITFRRRTRFIGH